MFGCGHSKVSMLASCVLTEASMTWMYISSSSTRILYLRRVCHTASQIDVAHALSLTTRECVVAAIMRSASRLWDSRLSYAAVAMLSAMPRLLPDGVGPSMKTKLPRRKVGVLQTQR